jgi:hypothetical protein
MRMFESRSTPAASVSSRQGTIFPLFALPGCGIRDHVLQPAQRSQRGECCLALAEHFRGCQPRNGIRFICRLQPRLDSHLRCCSSTGSGRCRLPSAWGSRMAVMVLNGVKASQRGDENPARVLEYPHDTLFIGARILLLPTMAVATLGVGDFGADRTRSL